MNLRTYTLDGGRKRRARRSAAAAPRWSLLATLLPFAIPLALLFAILVVRVNFNSEAEKLQRSGSQLTAKIHDAERDIQNMGMQIEHLKRRQYIYRQLANFNLGFRNPQPGQVRNLAPATPAAGGRVPAAPPAPRQLVVTRR